MREIVFDTETTGLDAYQGDRLVENRLRRTGERLAGWTYREERGRVFSFDSAGLQIHGILRAMAGLPGRRIS
jgi:hypothetical protein